MNAPNQTLNAVKIPRKRERGLEEHVGQCPPTGAISQGRLQPSQESRSGDERIRVVDVFVEQAPGDPPMEAANSSCAAKREADDCEPDERDGQGHSRGHGDHDERETEGRERNPEGQEQELRPGPLRERRAQNQPADIPDPGFEAFWDHDHHL